MSWYDIGAVKIWSFCMMKQLPPFWMNISAAITNIMCKEKEKNCISWQFQLRVEVQVLESHFLIIPNYGQNAELVAWFLTESLDDLAEMIVQLFGMLKIKTLMSLVGQNIRTAQMKSRCVKLKPERKCKIRTEQKQLNIL